jgi:chromosome segregation ATPase
VRLTRITVDDFQCIEHAEVDLGAGLNVLYGPNDLGKSSLAAAMRNVLLLPHGSSAYERLVSWHSGGAPRVALTFSTEPQRVWRVTKTFGTGGAGSSRLEFSRDGVSFSSDATGREVDGKIRELLRWGISPPGGRNVVRGIPDTFLTNVLLAEQIDVPDILARGLADDPNESGRERLNEALQALAQDPLFKRVLDQANQQANRAFTPTGRRKTSQGSPFQAVRDDLNELRRQRDALQTRLNDTLSAESTLRQLHSELDSLAAARAEAEEALASVREAREQMEARAGVEEELGAARAALAAIRAELADVDAAAQALALLHEAFGRAEATVAEQSTAAVDAAGRRDAAARRLQDVTNESGAQARQLALKQVENERLTAEGRQAQLRATVETAEEAKRRSDTAAEAGRALEVLRAQLGEAEAALGPLGEAEAAERDQVQQCQRIEAFGRLRQARRTLQLAQEAQDLAKTERETAATRHAEAARTEEEAAKLAVPDTSVVRALRRLAQELEVAEARLGGGISVAVAPNRELRLHVAIDGAEPDEHQVRAPVILDARRSLELRVDDVVHIAITAGEASARAEVERLRSRWAEEGAPILTRSGSATIAALEEARQRVDELQRQIAARRTEADGLEQSARQHDRQAEGLEALCQTLVEREQALAGHDQAELSAALDALGDGWERELERRRTAAQARSEAAAAKLQEARSRVTELSAQCTERATAYESAKRSAEQALAAFPNGTKAVLEQGRADLEALERAIADLTQRLGSLSQVAQEEESHARQLLSIAEQELTAATKTLQLGQADRDEKRDAVARATGDLDARRRQSERLDLEAAEIKVDRIAERLGGMPLPEAPACQNDVDAAEVNVQSLTRAVADKQGQILRAQGGLEQVGGAVVREQQEELDRALQLALEREHRVEVEYEAWRLLADTLRDVENRDGAHLGKALSGPLGECFRSLTGGRYGGVAVGKELNLEADGVEAGGQLRPFDALSVGTQEQLATLFRLCIAEQLHSAIVLDDHLSQSDADKMRWFRELLRSTGRSIQVVLLTCRPEDYLLADELPAGDEATCDRAAGTLRAVNLARVIRRYPLGNSQVTGPIEA